MTNAPVKTITMIRSPTLLEKRVKVGCRALWLSQEGGPTEAGTSFPRKSDASWMHGPRILALLATLFALFWQSAPGFCSAYNFFRVTTPGSIFAIDPDINIRKINPRAPNDLWTFGERWGVPPLFYHTRVPGFYERIDFLWPLGFREETAFLSKLKFAGLIESRWSKVPPFDGFSRCVGVYRGRSDIGQDYWGVFPFYGYTFRRFGVDSNSFFLFPLYYESTDEDAHTTRLLAPIVTYANSPGRRAFKIWPLFGQDAIRKDYFNRFVLWPFFQCTDKYPGTEQATSYTAMPFPIYVRQDDCYSTTTHLLWPLISYYYHYRSGFTRYTFRPLFSYGSGGGVEEFSFLIFYSYKKDHRQPTSSNDSDGYISVAEDEIFTERSFLKLSKIQKRYRKGCLVFARYKFWPFADYTWDRHKGSHLRMPEVFSSKSDWWDISVGRLLRFVDLRDTPISRELSTLFGWNQRTTLKRVPHVPTPPKPGEDDFSELLLGSFGKQ